MFLSDFILRRLRGFLFSGFLTKCNFKLELLLYRTRVKIKVKNLKNQFRRVKINCGSQIIHILKFDVYFIYFVVVRSVGRWGGGVAVPQGL